MNLHEIAKKANRRLQLEEELAEAEGDNPYRAEQLASGRWCVIGPGGASAIPRAGTAPEQERAETLAIELNLQAIAGGCL